MHASYILENTWNKHGSHTAANFLYKRIQTDSMEMPCAYAAFAEGNMPLRKRFGHFRKDTRCACTLVGILLTLKKQKKKEMPHQSRRRD